MTVVVPLKDVHVLYEVSEIDLDRFGHTLLSLSRSKALKSLYENSCEQWSPRIPMFFLKMLRVMSLLLLETFMNLYGKRTTFFLVS